MSTLYFIKENLKRAATKTQRRKNRKKERHISLPCFSEYEAKTWALISGYKNPTVKKIESSRSTKEEPLLAPKIIGE